MEDEKFLVLLSEVSMMSSGQEILESSLLPDQSPTLSALSTIWAQAEQT
jgi:hypothetical protein